MLDELSKKVVEHLLTLGDTMLCLDSRHPEVRVPAAHRDKADLRLVINIGFRHPIHVLPEGVQADLLFGGLLHHCWVPYEALWGAYNPRTGEGTVWPERIPSEVKSLVDPTAAAADPPSPPRKRTPRKRPGPAAVGEGSEPRKQGPVLRVIPGGKGKPPAP